MQPVSRDEIVKRLENIQPGEKLKLRTNRTFGDDMVILELNPAWPQKSEKKYLLWVGKTEEAARRDKPYLQSNKAKKVAGWASDRWAQWLPEEVAKKAA
jgi:hypothetical protein